VSEIAFLLFDGITSLDAVGPYEVLQRLPGATVRMLAREPGPKRDREGNLALVADCALGEVPSPDIVVVPGGFGVEAVMKDESTLEWLRRAHETARWTTSVCTGSLVLGAAGILKGLRATTHWMWMDRLRDFGAEPTEERVVFQGKVVTAAGVSSGIDMALRLVQLSAGDEIAQGIQLGIEYDPQPPFDAGSPHKAPAAVVEAVRRSMERMRDSGGTQ
jgi:transcriptional regulator GlxA family with amidase domain